MFLTLFEQKEKQPSGHRSNVLRIQGSVSLEFHPQKQSAAGVLVEVSSWTIIEDQRIGVIEEWFQLKKKTDP